MIVPTHMTHDVSRHRHQEMLEHSARIHMIQEDRRAGDAPSPRSAHRLVTVRRLAAAVLATFTAQDAATAR